MHTPILTSLVLASLAAAQEPASSPPLVVHEWGTFTSFQGSDGVMLEGLQHEEEALPPFVYELAELVELDAARAGRGRKFPASRVTQKMETPVIYFHTDEPRRVRVSVTFLDGLITQFFPMPEFVAPRLGELRQLFARTEGPVDLGEVPFSCVEWDVDLTPAGRGAGIEIPDVDRDDPWAEARRVRAAFVSTRDDPASGRRVESERYLFYRGVGRFELPLRAVVAGAHVRVSNDGDHRVPFAVAMEVTDDGRGRLRALGGIPAGTAVSGDVEDTAWREPDQMVGALHIALRTALVAEGLFDDEARAMVATWSRQWFRSPGRRVLWIVPRAQVDRLLPLTIEPTPTETVRVLVGRLEFLTPAAEDAVERALLERIDEDPAVRASADGFLAGLDRFLEPQVRRAFARTGSEQVRESAAELLRELSGR